MVSVRETTWGCVYRESFKFSLGAGLGDQVVPGSLKDYRGNSDLILVGKFSVATYISSLV